MPTTHAVDEGDVRVGGASVRWRKQGAGPAIVFLHGFPLSGCTWDAVVAHLRDRFTCYTLDLIGLGGSHSTEDDDYASPGQARAFQRTLRELGVDAYALVGNDTGGWIARELALVDTARVWALVLTNTEIPHHRPPWIPMYQALARVPGFGTVVARLLASSAFRRSSLAFGGCFHDLRLLDTDFQARFVAPLSAAHGMVGPTRLLRMMRFARLDEFAHLHERLTMPTLFVWGRDDPTFPEAIARKMVAQFPNVAGFHSIADAKLFVHEEHPGTVARLIGAFASAMLPAPS